MLPDYYAFILNFVENGSVLIRSFFALYREQTSSSDDGIGPAVSEF
jgi:hypothetical protein